MKCHILLYGGDWGSSKSGGSFTGFLRVEGPAVYLLAMLALSNSLSDMDMCVRAEEKEFLALAGILVFGGGGVVVYLYCGMGTSNPTGL